MYVALIIKTIECISLSVLLMYFDKTYVHANMGVYNIQKNYNYILDFY